jgi:SAM-dependent methyltransferase
VRNLEYTACPLCGSGDSVEKLGARDFLFSQEEFAVAKCSGCGLEYTNPRVKENDIGEYYFPGYSAYGSKKPPNLIRRFIGGAGRMVGDVHREVLAELRSIRAQSVLEIGPGNGELLYFLKARGFEVAGVERDANCARALTKGGINCYPDTLKNVMEQLKPGEFDAVILCQVFEHLYHPLETLENIRHVLKEEGIIYLTLPDSASLEARVFGKYWRGLDLPRHVVHYDKGKIRTLLVRSGFEILKSGNCDFSSSFVESIGFLILRGKKMPSPFYYSLYYPWRLLSPLHIRIIGSGVIRIVARKSKI